MSIYYLALYICYASVKGHNYDGQVYRSYLSNSCNDNNTYTVYTYVYMQYRHV